MAKLRTALFIALSVLVANGRLALAQDSPAGAATGSDAPPLNLQGLFTPQPQYPTPQTPVNPEVPQGTDPTKLFNIQPQYPTPQNPGYDIPKSSSDPERSPLQGYFTGQPHYVTPQTQLNPIAVPKGWQPASASSSKPDSSGGGNANAGGADKTDADKTGAGKPEAAPVPGDKTKKAEEKGKSGNEKKSTEKKAASKEKSGGKSKEGSEKSSSKGSAKDKEKSGKGEKGSGKEEQTSDSKSDKKSSKSPVVAPLPDIEPIKSKLFEKDKFFASSNEKTDETAKTDEKSGDSGSQKDKDSMSSSSGDDNGDSDEDKETKEKALLKQAGAYSPIKEAAFYLRSAQYDQALVILMKEAKTNPGSAQINYLMAVTHVGLRQYKQAAEEYNAVLKISPDTKLGSLALEGLKKIGYPVQLPPVKLPPAKVQK